MKTFRLNHLFKILSTFDFKGSPVDLHLHGYFRRNSALGSKDRKEIAEAVYFIIRYLGLIDAFITPPVSWEKRVEIFLQKKYEETPPDNLPSFKKYSFPKHYFDLLVDSLGEEKAIEFCQVSNQQAPTTLRVNSLKISREDLLQKLSLLYPATLCTHSPVGIQMQDRSALFSTEEFKNGYFEMQDEGSQLVSLEVAAMPHQTILDYCAGSGGKTLGLAHQMEGKGQIFLHDIRIKALYEARKRMKRAGIQNYQLIFDSRDLRKKIPQGCDWILLDVPCSGSGTLRRNPDQKWRFTIEDFENLIQLQRKIFEEALPLLKPNGKIVYATCSIFPQENAEQIEFFIKKYNLRLVKPPLNLFPTSQGMDGFFAATLEKSDNNSSIC